MSRFIYSSARQIVRAQARKPAKPCGHICGTFVTLLALPFVAVVFLIVLGFLQR
jgi:hypothetical protein